MSEEHRSIDEKHKATFDAKERANDAIYIAIKTMATEAGEGLTLDAYELLSSLNAIDFDNNTECIKAKIRAIYTALHDAHAAGQALGQMLSWGSSSWGGTWLDYEPVERRDV